MRRCTDEDGTAVSNKIDAYPHFNLHTLSTIERYISSRISENHYYELRASVYFDGIFSRVILSLQQITVYLYSRAQTSLRRIRRW